MTDRDRLIKIVDDFGDDISFCDICKRPKEDCEGCKNEQLADYLLANGVIVPPCKVGDVMYSLYRGAIHRTIVFSVVAETKNDNWIYIVEGEIFNGISIFRKFIVGKTVFLTKEEAEQALKEREG